MDRMSPLDASFLHIEDGVSHMHIASIAIFEGPPPDYADVVAMIEGKLPAVPRYRQVVRFVPLELGRPVWAGDPHFNIEYHVRHTALPEPGGTAELRRLVGRVMAQPLDRSKPLWEAWMVEGLEDGQWAMLSKTHHCMVDGVSGTDLLSVIFDKTPEPSPPLPDTWEPGRTPGDVELAAAAIGDLLRSPYEQARAVRARLRAPRQAFDQLREVAKGIASAAGVVRPTPPSSLNGPIGPHRRYAWAETTLDDVKSVRKALGGTVNDVVLAVITRGFRDLLLGRGESVDNRVVRTLVPVSVRVKGPTGLAVGDGTYDNKVSGMIAELPVGIADPVERLHAIRAQMEGLKESKQAVAGEALTSLSGFAPPMLLSLGTRLVVRMPQRNVNTVTTNVPGPQQPLYVAGRRMLRAYPYVPLASQVRIGVAIFSYSGLLTYGVTGDYDTAPDIDVLCRGIEDGLGELLKLSA
jgi:diacylglycerol O-acyltransferase